MKRYFGLGIPLLWFNAGVLLLSILTMFFILYLILKRQIRLTRT